MLNLISELFISSWFTEITTLVYRLSQTIKQWILVIIYFSQLTLKFQHTMLYMHVL